MFFVNLPLRYVGEDPSWLDAFIVRGLPPEFGLDATALDRLDESWHQRTAERLRDTGLPCSVHLPFEDIRPASPDAFMAEAARQRLLAAVRIANIYEPRHMVAHPYLFPPNDPEREADQLEVSLATWEVVLDAAPDCPLLALENTHDKDPGRLADLVARLRKEHGTRVGVCFDVGHWHSFSGGHAEKDARYWVEELGPYIRHCHLHDNSGLGDDHAGLGTGGIPWSEILDLLAGLPERPTATLEPHTEEALTSSLTFIEAHRVRFAAIFRSAGE